VIGFYLLNAERRCGLVTFGFIGVVLISELLLSRSLLGSCRLLVGLNYSLAYLVSRCCACFFMSWGWIGITLDSESMFKTIFRNWVLVSALLWMLGGCVGGLAFGFCVGWVLRAGGRVANARARLPSQ